MFSDIPPPQNHHHLKADSSPAAAKDLTSSPSQHLDSAEKRLTDFHELVCKLIGQLEIPNHLRQGSEIFMTLQEIVKLFDYFSKGDAQTYLSNYGATEDDISWSIRLSNRFSREMKILIKKLTMDHSEGLEYITSIRESPMTSNAHHHHHLSTTNSNTAASPSHFSFEGSAVVGSPATSNPSLSSSPSFLHSRQLIFEYDQILASLTKTMMQLTDIMKKHEIRFYYHRHPGNSSENHIKNRSARFLDLWPVFEGLAETVFSKIIEIFGKTSSHHHYSSSRSLEVMEEECGDGDHQLLLDMRHSLNRSLSLLCMICKELCVDRKEDDKILELAGSFEAQSDLLEKSMIEFLESPCHQSRYKVHRACHSISSTLKYLIIHFQS